MKGGEVMDKVKSFRLDDLDREYIDVIKSAMQFTKDSDAIRYALEFTYYVIGYTLSQVWKNKEKRDKK